jgi:hypothetical protein
LAILAARSFDMPLSFSASYCFSFFTLGRVFGMAHLLSYANTRLGPTHNELGQGDRVTILGHNASVFERFTDRARRVVVLAQEEARLLNHNYIGTEHVLLGLLHEGEGIAARVLESVQISLEVVRIKVEAIVGLGSSSPTGHIPFTPRAKKALENALREALQLGDNFIGTEHLLLGLLRERQGVAVQVLTDLGADLGHMREQVIGLAGGERTERVETEDLEATSTSGGELLVESLLGEVAASASTSTASGKRSNTHRHGSRISSRPHRPISRC